MLCGPGEAAEAVTHTRAYMHSTAEQYVTWCPPTHVRTCSRPQAHVSSGAGLFGIPSHCCGTREFTWWNRVAYGAHADVRVAWRVCAHRLCFEFTTSNNIHTIDVSERCQTHVQQSTATKATIASHSSTRSCGCFAQRTSEPRLLGCHRCCRQSSNVPG